LEKVLLAPLISPKAIADVLGLSKKPASLTALAGVVSRGLPKTSLRNVIHAVFTSPSDRAEALYRVIPKGTYKRRKAQLSPEESARVERLARVIATARYVWDDDEAAREFLTSRHTELENRTPIEVAMTELGAREVELLLWKLFYGVPA